VSEGAKPEAISAIPVRGVLLHIGPPKTGTTAVQEASNAARSSMLEQGVRYGGPGQQPSTAAFAVIGRKHASTGMVPSMYHWHQLRKEVVNAREQRVFVSSEFLAAATSDQAARIVRDLGGDRVQIAVTLRPLTKILASRWQQNVQEGTALPYSEWLTAVLRDPDSDFYKRFWLRQQHADLIDRWVNVVGPGRVTVLVADDENRNDLLRGIEQLLGLRAETLVPPVTSLNRSLTAAEVESIRLFNVAYRAAKLPVSLRYKLMSRGGAELLKRRTVEQGEPRIVTPAWAVEEARVIAQKMVTQIAASGVHIIGDLTKLTGGLDAAAIGEMEQGTLKGSPEIAASLAMGILFASGVTRGYEEGSRVPAWVEPEPLRRIPTRNLLIVVVQRQIQAILLRLRRLVRR
jgi:hypothetical protein